MDLLTKNIFGTDGIRNKVGEDLLTLENIAKLGRALALWACNKYSPLPIKILLGCDTRISCDFVKSALTSGLLLSPVTVIDAGIVPTPALAQLLEKDNSYNLAVMISASHNTYEDNGIKIIEKNTGKLSLLDELKISEIFNSLELPVDYTSLGGIEKFCSAGAEYEKIVVALFPSQFLIHKKIVLDCAHGATYKIAPAIFEKLGAHVIALNKSPNGTNINSKCGATDLTFLKKAVLEYRADIGFAFDGDGDRLMIVACSGETRNGDDILALLSTYSGYQHQSAVVSTVMSNQGLEDFLKTKNKILVRTSVGDKYVVKALQENNFVVGGEQSGHIILTDLETTGDGIMAALRVCQVLQETDNWQVKTFDAYPQVLINVHVAHKKDLNSGAGLSLIQKAEAQIESGRILVRYSGTENVLRVMVEESNKERAERIAQDLARDLKEYLD